MLESYNIRYFKLSISIGAVDLYFPQDLCRIEFELTRVYSCAFYNRYLWNTAAVPSNSMRRLVVLFVHFRELVTAMSILGMAGDPSETDCKCLVCFRFDVI